ncbi:APOB protein, partial [Polyodon spathula]|nr:APOB protein [Polyodon spathula]
MLEGLNQRIPRMASAVYSCINKYHRQHFEMDINTFFVMLKDNIQNYIEIVYRETSKKIDELEMCLRNKVKYASSKYEQVKDKTKNIYKRAADNMAKVDLQDLSSKFYDASIDLIREYQKNIKHLLDATIKFLRVTKFQLPGFNQMYTGQELFNKAADSASVMIDKILQQVKNFLQQYTDALIKYINDMEIKVPGTDKILQGKEVLDSIKDYLRKVQNEVVDAVKSLRNVNLEKSLQKLKEFFQTSFMQVEEVLKSLKSKTLEEIKVQVQAMYNDAINSPLTAQIKYGLDYVKDSATHFYEFTQTCLNYAVDELEKTSRYVKSLREEYLDANMVGWMVKYYEIEEKMIKLVKSCAEYVKETGSKYTEEVITYVTHLTEKLKELVDNQGTEYLNYAKDLLTDADGRGMKMISELSNKAQAQIHEWSTLAKNVATEYRDHAQLKLQEAYDNLSLDKLTSEAKRLFDIINQQYSAYYQAILEILKELNNNIQPYIQYRDEKLQVDVPLPFIWESFDELPKRKEQ